jgi:hypothetical protein
MIIKHFAKNLLAFEGVACEMESDGVAEGAGTIKEVILWLGRYDQLCIVHATIMPQLGLRHEALYGGIENFSPITRLARFSVGRTSVFHMADRIV